MLDLAILGGSIAGITAAIYGKRRNLILKVIAPEVGGELATTTDIENWPGENKISGFDFSNKLYEQLKYNKVEFDLGSAVTKINKITAVIGGGNSALTSALMLSEIASVVYLLNVHPEFRGETILIDKVKNNPNIKILTEIKMQKITGEKMVQALEYADKTGITQTLPVQGIFVNIGMQANA